MSATRHGHPGEWAKVRGTVMSLWPLFVCFAALGAFATAVVLGRYTVWFAGAFVGAVAATAVLWRKGLYRVQSYFKGARGEERVASLLGTLPTGWHVFHDFRAGKFHVDHVVVGPAGICAVETKNWRGRVTVEEDEVLVENVLPDRSPLKQATNQAEAVKAVLVQAGWDGVAEVVPVLCFASDACVQPGQVVRRVRVLNATELAPWLLKRPVVLGPNDVARLAQLLETRAYA